MTSAPAKVRSSPKASGRRRLAARGAVAFGVGAAFSMLSPRVAVANHSKYEGSIKYTIFEQFGVTATETLTRMSYTDTGSGVYDADPIPGFCYHSGFPGWTIRECTGYFFDNSPTSAQKDIVGDFDSFFGPSYTQFSYFRAVPGGSAWYCEMTRGSLPPAWDQECSPKRTFVASQPHPK